MTALPLLAKYPAAGEVIDGKYRVISLLGEGGMGAVAKCEHLLRKAPVALKFMAPHMMMTDGGVERFLNEAVLASQLPSDHVVSIVDVGKLPSGAPYLVMEYLDGRDLASLIADEGAVDVARAVFIVVQVLRALQVAHAAGVVHRDLKPANVFLIDKDGERDFVKLLDFGISKAPQSAGITRTNTALGTPLYMSPEQARNPKEVDARADLYSVGVILYELLSGRTPHVSESGEATEVILKLFTQEPPALSSLRPEIPAALARAVHRAIARERDERFGDARAMAEALAPFGDARVASELAKMHAFTGAKLAGGLDAKEDFARLGSTPAPPLHGAQATVAALATTHPSTPVPRPKRPWLLVASVVLSAAIAITYGLAKLADVPRAKEDPAPSVANAPLSLPSVAPSSVAPTNVAPSASPTIASPPASVSTTAASAPRAPTSAPAPTPSLKFGLHP